MTESTVYLIGGAPGAGKSTLGLELAITLGVPSLTIDDIRTALLATTTAESHPPIHVIGLPDPWAYFTTTSVDDLVAHALSQHAALWPAVERVIRKRTANGQRLVIDGWHLMPSLVAGSELADVDGVWIEVAPAVLEARERAIWDFYARSDDPEAMFSNFLGRSTTWNELMRDEATEFGFRLIHQDGHRPTEDLAGEVLAHR